MCLLKMCHSTFWPPIRISTKATKNCGYKFFSKIWTSFQQFEVNSIFPFSIVFPNFNFDIFVSIYFYNLTKIVYPPHSWVLRRFIYCLCSSNSIRIVHFLNIIQFSFICFECRKSKPNLLAHQIWKNLNLVKFYWLYWEASFSNIAPYRYENFSDLVPKKRNGY